MDELVDCLQQFVITGKAELFEKSLDDIINKLDKKFDLNDPDIEWGIVISNYSKLRYLNLTCSFQNFQILEPKFLIALDKVMCHIDKSTQKYLRQINWDDHEPHISKESYAIIKDNFEKSLNSNDQLKKIDFLLNAYKIFVPIIEKIRNEKFVDTIDDREFLTTFKKQKRT